MLLDLTILVIDFRQLPEKERIYFLTAYARLMVSHGKVEDAVHVIDQHMLSDQRKISPSGKPTLIDVTSRHVAGLNLRGILMTTQGYGIPCSPMGVFVFCFSHQLFVLYLNQIFSKYGIAEKNWLAALDLCYQIQDLGLSNGVKQPFAVASTNQPFLTTNPPSLVLGPILSRMNLSQPVVTALRGIYAEFESVSRFHDQHSEKMKSTGTAFGSDQTTFRRNFSSQSADSPILATPIVGAKPSFVAQDLDRYVALLQTGTSLLDAFRPGDSKSGDPSQPKHQNTGAAPTLAISSTTFGEYFIINCELYVIMSNLLSLYQGQRRMAEAQLIAGELIQFFERLASKSINQHGFNHMVPNWGISIYESNELSCLFLFMSWICIFSVRIYMLFR
jgi:hypothetical protein